MQTWIKGVAIVLATASVLVASACVGEDAALTTGSSRADGERGGKCFPNDTCTGKELACIDGLCVLPGDVGGEAGADAGPGAVDGSTTSDGGDAGADASSEGGCAPPQRGAPNEVACNGPTTSTCPAVPGCCTQTGSCAQGCAGTTTNMFGCEGPNDCTGNAPVCCVSTLSGAAVVQPGQCPPKLADWKSSTCVVTPNNCPGLIACSASEPCGSGSTCRSMQLDVGTAAANNAKTFTIGVCIPDATP